MLILAKMSDIKKQGAIFDKLAFKWYGSIKTSSTFPAIDENRSIRAGRVLQSNSVSCKRK
jgi:hypothetical protein